MSFRSGTKCIVVNTYDNKLFCIINKGIYLLLLVEKQERDTSASKNGFKPADNHPWRSKNRFE